MFRNGHLGHSVVKCKAERWKELGERDIAVGVLQWPQQQQSRCTKRQATLKEEDADDSSQVTAPWQEHSMMNGSDRSNS